MNNLQKVLSGHFLNIVLKKGGEKADFLKMSENLKQARLVQRKFHTRGSNSFPHQH